jgi:hypothetical protein
MIAISEGKGPQNVPIPDKEEMMKKIGSAIKVISIKQTDTLDGGRVIELEGAFSRPEQFFLSEYCRDSLKLRISPAGKGKAAIYCDMEQSGDGGPNLTQLYGLAKGLYIKKTIHLPTKVEKTNGYWDKAKNTVSWAIDLRNKEGLAKTKQFIEGPDEGDGFAVFDASELKFSLPLKAAASTKKAIDTEKDGTQKEPTGLKAKVCWISVKKKMAIDATVAAETSDLEIGIEISWNEGLSPIACRKPVLLSLLDDQNNDLVSDNASPTSQRQIFSREKKDRKKLLTVRAKTPAKNTKKLKDLEGYVEVITGVTKETVVLDNIQELLGRESTGNPILDKLNFQIKSIKGSSLKIKIDGGNDRITSLYMIKGDDSKVKKRGGMGWGDEYSYDFGEDISDFNKSELEVVVAQKIVKVPFALEQAILP